MASIQKDHNFLATRRR